MEKNKSPEVPAYENNSDEAMQRLGRELHAELFPEEYDQIYDSFSDARDRQQGISPMNAEYVKKTNFLRTRLGFTPFNVGPNAYNDNTLAWVLEQLQQGREAELREIIADRAHKAFETERRREQARQELQTPSWLDQRIDDMLSGDKFIHDGQDRSDPYVIAFRILGEIFSVNASGDNRPEYFRQIRRLIPGRSETEYQALYLHSMNEWMEAYGY